MLVRDFDFALPPDLIAQEPAGDRSAARLLCLDRVTGQIEHRVVADLPEKLRNGDCLVVNNTRVFPARLLGRRVPSGGAVECLLVARMPGETDGPSGGSDRSERWEALMHPGQRLGPGSRVIFDGAAVLHGEILARRFHGRRELRLWAEDGSPVDQAVDAIGHVPLPPYIKRPDRTDDRDRYQTVFARERGSVAAPTAGLHLSPPLLAALRARGVLVVEITLHVEEHRLEAERYHIDATAASAVNLALDEGRRVVAVGTTTTRALEAVARANEGRLIEGSGATDLFISEGFRFRVIGGLLTNFHLPQSSLLMLVSAFAGRERVLAAYQAAIAERYRFYSYGDAMLVL